MRAVDLIQELRDHAETQIEDNLDYIKRADILMRRAAATLASKDTALAEIRAELERERELKDHARKCCDTAETALVKVRKALEDLASAKALKGVRELVAGWNGEYRIDGPYDRHPSELGATMPPTNCGAVYQLDAAMIAAHHVLFDTRHASRARGTVVSADANGWMLIETAPKDGTDILGFWSYLYQGDRSPTFGFDVISWERNLIPDSDLQGWVDRDGLCQEGVYSHWQSLKPPLATSTHEGDTK